jgi:hypothetical protein
MSTKTTFKRLALVTVAALGLGVLSVAPSSAYTQADTLTLSSTTAAVTTAETATATSAPTATISFLANAATDSMTVTASLVSAPATSTALPYLQLSESTSALVVTSPTAVLTNNQVAPNTPVFVNTTGGSAATRVSATFKVYLSSNGVLAPTVAGTYVVRLTPAVPVAAQGALSSAAQTITFTVAKSAADDTVATSATVWVNTGETTSATSDAVVLASKTASTSASAATITVALKNSAGLTATESYTATLTGSGTLGSGTQTTATAHDATALGRSITVKAGNSVGVFADGTGGVGTITISSAAGVTLAKKTVTFYGDVAAIVASVNTPVMGVKANSAGISAVAYDANGYLVGGATLYATSSDTTIVSNSYTPGATTTSATAGKADFTITGVKTGTAKITVGLAISATDVTTTGYAIKSDAVTVTIGGGAAELADIIVSLDKQSYAPGGVAYVTITPVDAAGKPLAPGTYTGITTGGILTSVPLDSITAGSMTSKDVTTIAANSTATADTLATLANTFAYRVFMPKVEGDVTFSYTTGSVSVFAGNTANAAQARSITVAVSNPGSQAAVDAAAEATDAANAATDAALAAADAADAATAAAEDASAAVATLSKSVTTALNNLKKQITSLTALVNKLLKR